MTAIDLETVVTVLEVLQHGGDAVDVALLVELLEVSPREEASAYRLHAQLLSVEASYWQGEAARRSFLERARPWCLDPDLAVVMLSEDERAQFEALGGGQ